MISLRLFAYLAPSRARISQRRQESRRAEAVLLLPRKESALDFFARVALAEVVVPNGSGKIDVLDQDLFLFPATATEPHGGNVGNPHVVAVASAGLLKHAHQRLQLIAEGRFGMILPKDLPEGLRQVVARDP